MHIPEKKPITQNTRAILGNYLSSIIYLSRNMLSVEIEFFADIHNFLK